MRQSSSKISPFISSFLSKLVLPCLFACCFLLCCVPQIQAGQSLEQIEPASHSSNIPSTSTTPQDHNNLQLLPAVLTICFGALFIFFLLYMNRRLSQTVAKHTEELSKRDELFREVFNNMDSGVAIYDAIDNGNDFRFKDLNPAGCKYSQVKREDILNKNVTEIFPGVGEFGLLAVFQRVWQTGAPENHPTSVYKDEKLVCWVENYVYKLPSGEIVAIYNDVTKQQEAAIMQKKCELAILQAKEEWQRSFDAIPDLVTIMDEDMHIVRANKAAHFFFNVQPGELRGKYCYEVFHGSCHRCQDCPLTETIKGNNACTETITHENLGKTFLVSFAAIHDDTSDKKHFIHISRDITEQKRLEAELIQAHKMEAVGNLASGIAHDFNNILSAIMGYSELAKRNLPPESSASQDIDHIITAGKRAGTLVQQILDFSHKTDQHLQPVQPHLIVQESLQMLRAGLPSTVKIVTNIDPDCGAIMADPTKIAQVVMNLCTNSFHALKDEKGILTVTLHRQDKIAKGVAMKGTAPCPFIVLSVSDTGSGMDPETTAQIFDPYFTTKARGKGTGLGLAVVHGIIESCNGYIEVESKPGEGSTIKVFIPALDHEFPAPKVAEAQATSLTGSERILIVDDELMLVRIGQRILEDYGYTVTGLTKSQAALEKVRANPQQFDLIITDQTMPGLTGFDLAKGVLEIVPDMPIILCTGHSELATAKNAYAMGIKKYLRKPIRGDELAKTVRKVLDKQKK
jgi:PAS domain S-box-containing protein